METILHFEIHRRDTLPLAECQEDLRRMTKQIVEVWLSIEKQYRKYQSASVSERPRCGNEVQKRSSRDAYNKPWNLFCSSDLSLYRKAHKWNVTITSTLFYGVGELELDRKEEWRVGSSSDLQKNTALEFDSSGHRRLSYENMVKESSKHSRDQDAIREVK